jgi:hypothetical protein
VRIVGCARAVVVPQSTNPGCAIPECKIAPIGSFWCPSCSDGVIAGFVGVARIRGGCSRCVGLRPRPDYCF